MNIIITIQGGLVVSVHRSFHHANDKIAVVDLDNRDIGANPVYQVDGHVEIYGDLTDVFPQDNESNREIVDELKSLKF